MRSMHPMMEFLAKRRLLCTTAHAAKCSRAILAQCHVLCSSSYLPLLQLTFGSN